MRRHAARLSSQAPALVGVAAGLLALSIAACDSKVAISPTAPNGAMRPRPPNPTEPHAAAASPYAVKLSWASGEGSTTGFVIAYQPGPEPPASCTTGQTVTVDIPQGEPIVVPNLDPGTPYSFRICAIDDRVEPKYSVGVVVTLKTPHDRPPPSVAFTSRGFIHQAVERSYTVEGSCSEEGRAVVITGAFETTVSCTHQSFAFAFDSAAMKDGPLTLVAAHANMDDLAAPPATLTLTKDTVPPRLTATSVTTAVNNTNVRAYRVSGMCSESGQPVEISGPFKGGKTTCINGSYALALDLSEALDGTVPITASHADEAGNPALPAVLNATKFVQRPTTTLDNNGAINGTNAAAYHISGRCSENGRSVSIGGTVVRSTICLGGFYTMTVNYSGAADGPVTVTINHTGADGSTAVPLQASLTKDTSRPIVVFYAMTPITAAKAATFTVRGACSEAGQNVVLGGALNASGPCDGAAFAIPVNYTSVADGSVPVIADLKDAAGNMATRASLALVKDTTIPTVTLENRGYLNTENAAHYVISGTCSENNRAVVLGGTLAKSVMCVNRTFQTALDYSAIPDGPVSLTADQTDSAGNPAVQATVLLSKVSMIPTVTIENSGPIKMANVAAYILRGTCSEPGQNVGISGGITATTVCLADKTFSQAVNYTAVADGSYTLTAAHSSTSGNVAPPATLTVVKDTVKPTIHITNGDAINATNKLSFAITGLCSDFQRPVSITATDGVSTTTGSALCVNGGFSAPTNFGSLMDGPLSVAANMADTVGNPAVTSQVTLTRDTVLPTVRITSTGYINAAEVAGYTVRGTCSENGRLVTLAGRLGGTATCTLGAFATSLNYSQADEGAIAVTAMMADAAGNISPVSSVTLTKDTTPALFSISDATPINASNQTAYPITGTCSEAYRTVSIGGAVSGTTACSALGVFTLVRDMSGLPEGTVLLTVSQADAAGNTRAALSASLTKNTTRPQVTITATDAISASNAARYLITGTCSEKGRLVALSGSIPAVTTTCTNANDFSILLDLRGVNDGLVSMTAVQTSPAGSPALPQTVSLFKDTWPPTVRITNTNAVNATNANAFEVTGTCTESGHEVAITGSASGTTTCVLGTFRAILNYFLLPDGSLTITANHRDSAGNEAVPVSLSSTKDTVIPTVEINRPGYVNVANAGGFLLSGTCSEESRLVHLGGSVSRAVNCSGGSYSATVDLSAFPDGSIPVTADHLDFAGNSAVTATVTVTKLTSTPTVSITSSGYINADAAGSYHVTGTCSENSQAVTLSGALSGSTVCSGGNFDLVLDTTGLPDGALTVRADHKSASNNPANSSTVTLTKDTIAPALAITSTAPITQQNAAAYTVTGTCSEPNRPMTLGGGVGATSTCNGSSFTLTINYAAIADGHVAITAGMRDAAGNPALISSAGVFKDTAAPTVTITSSAAVNLRNQAAYPVTGVCSEDGGTVSLTGAAIGQAPCLAGSFATTVDLRGQADGTLSLHANLLDTVGNAATTFLRTLTKDTVVPTVTLTGSGSISTVNSTGYRINGTCSDSGRNVTIGGTLSATTPCTSGAYATTLDFSSVIDGSVSITASQTDTAENTSPSASLTVTKVTSRPLVTVTDQGAINLTNASNYTITGTCSENDRNLSLSGTISAGTPCANGVYAVSVNYQAIPDGTITIMANLADASGNQAIPASRNILKDTTPPIVTLSSENPLNASTVHAYTVAGTCSEVGRAVTLTGSANGSTTCAADQTFRFNMAFPGVTDGPVNLTATQTDAVGNSATSGAITVIKDTGVPILTLETSGPIYNENQRSYILTGQCSESGRSVLLTGSLTATTTCTADRYTFHLDFSSVADGPITVATSQTDATGNAAIPVSQSLTKNTRTPIISFSATPPINAHNAAAYTLAGVCSENAQNVMITGAVNDQILCSGNAFTKTFDLRSVPDSAQLQVTAQHGSSEGNAAIPYHLTLAKDTIVPHVSLRTGGYVNASNAGSYLVAGTCSEEGGTVRITGAAVANPTCANGAFAVSLNLSSVASGPVLLYADLTDPAGNSSVQAEVTLVKETVLPTLSLHTLAPINSSNVDAYVVSGSCSKDGQTVTFSGDGTAVESCASGYFAHIFNLRSKVDGTLTITVSHGSAPEDPTPVTASILKDVVRPTVTVSNSGSIASGQDTAYVLHGTCSEHGQPVALSGTSAATATCTNGTYSITLNVAGISDGPLTIQADHTDLAGNHASTAAVTVTKDTQVPVVAITSTAVINALTQAAYTLTGTCTAPQEPIVLGGSLSVTGMCGLNNNFAVTVDYSSQADGPIMVTARQTDAAGNVSQLASKTLQKVTVKPAFTVDPVSTINLANVASINLAGTCTENNADILFTGSFSAGAVCANGRFSVIKDLSLVPDGQITLVAQMTDRYGNLAVPITLTPTKDTTVPSVTLGIAGFINSTSVRTYNVVGSCSESSRTVTIGGAITGSATCSGGVFSLVRDMSGVADGPVTLTVTTTDTAGNVSRPEGTTVIKDTVAPTLTYTSTTAVNSVNRAAYRLTGTCSESSRIVTVSGPVSGTTSCISGTFAATLNYEQLADGPLTVGVSQTDTAGNTSPVVTQSLTKDTVVPEVTLHTLSPINGATAAAYHVSGTCSENSRLVMLSGSLTATAPCNTGTFALDLDYAAVPDGTVTLIANLADAAGNSAVAQTKTVAKDVMPPTLSLSNTGFITATNASAYSITGTCSDNARPVTITGTLASSSTCASQTYTVLVDASSVADGPITLRAVTSDTSGNLSTTATVTVIKETVAPIPGSGGSVVLSRIRETMMVVSWAQASDNLTAQENLYYQVIYATTPDILSVSTALRNGTAASSPLRNTTTFEIGNLTPDTPYYVTVLVTDSAGNASVYGVTSGSTAPSSISSTGVDLQRSSQPRSFFDSVNGRHWVFTGEGDHIEYRSAFGNNAWSSSGTLAAVNPQFAVAYKALGGVAYVFLVTTRGHDIVLRRGVISGSTITFAPEQPVLTGVDASDAYVRPTLALDSSDRIWVGAVRRTFTAGIATFKVYVKRSVATGSGNLATWGDATALTPSIGSIEDLILVALSQEAMGAVVNAAQLLAYRYNGATWSSSQSGGTASWLTFPANTLTGDVQALAVKNSYLYAAGSFGHAGGVPGTSSIARWNGTVWESLGGGIDGIVRALAIDDQGTVYAGGSFASAGGIAGTAYLARWNGFGWQPLGTGINGTVYALAVDQTNRLYVGGRFTSAGGVTHTRNIARWSAATWSALSTGTDGDVLSLAVTSDGKVFAGGSFTVAGGVGSTSGIARWDDDGGWIGLGTGITGRVTSIVAPSSNAVYAGGVFTSAGGTAAVGIAKFEGGSWAPLGSGMTLNGGSNGTSVDALAMDSNGRLYAGGVFTSAGGVPDTSHLARWNGSSWEALGSGVSGSVQALAVNGVGDIFAGGTFTSAGGLTNTGTLARFIHGAWTSLSAGMDQSINALAADGNGNVYAGGNFTNAGGVASTRYIAKWTGSVWQALGTGMTGPVRALLVTPQGLVAAGDFSSAGGVPDTRYIALWNGTSWLPFGAGFNAGVAALAMDTRGALYAGGDFTATGSTPLNRMAKWSGSAWLPLGAGTNGSVLALAADTAGNIYAGGSFSQAGSVVHTSSVARWDGADWSSLGSGLNATVYALAVSSGGQLYAGGAFTGSGTTALARIARWNGSAWSSLGSGQSQWVYSLAVDGSGNVYAGSDPSAGPGGRFTGSVSRWDGSVWQNLGDGINSAVSTLALSSSGRLYAGGGFTAAGGWPTNYFAAWPLAATEGVGQGGVRGVAAVGDPQTNSLHVLKTHIDGATRLTHESGSWAPAVALKSAAGFGVQLNHPVMAIDPTLNTLWAFWTQSGSIWQTVSTNTTWSAVTAQEITSGLKPYGLGIAPVLTQGQVRLTVGDVSSGSTRLLILTTP